MDVAPSRHSWQVVSPPPAPERENEKKKRKVSLAVLAIRASLFSGISLPSLACTGHVYALVTISRSPFSPACKRRRRTQLSIAWKVATEAQNGIQRKPRYSVVYKMAATTVNLLEWCLHAMRPRFASRVA